jgi:hypothetical protein
MLRAYFERLVRVTDVRNIGFVLECMREETLQCAAEAKLLQLLPAVTATDTLKLSKRHRERLHRALLSRNLELVTAVLRALEQVGDRTSVPFVRAITGGDNKVGVSPDVSAAALSCLCVLQARAELDKWLAEANKSQATLLRPSSKDTEDGLLRAAKAESEINDNGLVAPSIAPEAAE